MREQEDAQRARKAIVDARFQAVQDTAIVACLKREADQAAEDREKAFHAKFNLDAEVERTKAAGSAREKLLEEERREGAARVQRLQAESDARIARLPKAPQAPPVPKVRPPYTDARMHISEGAALSLVGDRRRSKSLRRRSKMTPEAPSRSLPVDALGAQSSSSAAAAQPEPETAGGQQSSSCAAEVSSNPNEWLNRPRVESKSTDIRLRSGAAVHISPAGFTSAGSVLPSMPSSSSGGCSAGADVRGRRKFGIDEFRATGALTLERGEMSESLERLVDEMLTARTHLSLLHL